MSYISKQLKVKRSISKIYLWFTGSLATSPLLWDFFQFCWGCSSSKEGIMPSPSSSLWYHHHHHHHYCIIVSLYHRIVVSLYYCIIVSWHHVHNSALGAVSDKVDKYKVSLNVCLTLHRDKTELQTKTNHLDFAFVFRCKSYLFSAALCNFDSCNLHLFVLKIICFQLQFAFFQLQFVLFCRMNSYLYWGTMVAVCTFYVYIFTFFFFHFCTICVFFVHFTSLYICVIFCTFCVYSCTCCV